ncbi:cytochrome P450 [Alicyclobacillus vulcanalis]|uniref:Cytochrome P450 n=1 Tax=Alicyclobacillus vulcanalis TaxID=252246 RepID=A0A1N7LI58_9BACL|nr:cytochrome P450 [Alicyclobacillus vulcanalis]SIS73548.1 Cytochrome P450 [Alicyclobacillus vulcanalis]
MREHVHPAIPSTRHLDAKSGLRALTSMISHPGSPLMGLLALHRSLRADEFCLDAPRLHMRVAAGPAAVKRVLHDEAGAHRSRVEGDPVTRLFGDGLLVLDGPEHQRVKSLLLAASPRSALESRLQNSLTALDEAVQRAIAKGALWLPDAPRRITWRALEAVYFDHALTPAEERAHFDDLVQLVDYIGPGAWMLTGRTPRRPKAYTRMRARLCTVYREALERPGDAPIHALALRYGEAGASFAVDQLLTLLVAGHDTATSLLSSLLILLGQREEIQSALRNEVSAAAGDGLPDVRTVDELPLLDAVVKEALRLYPPIHSGLRAHVSSGERAMVSYFLLHRHQDFWPHPDAFVPERWRVSGPPGAYTYLPFGAGPRFCPGATFARLEVKWILARILQTVRVALPSRPPRIAMRAALEHRPTKIRVSRR